MKYMGSKARIAKHILPIILADRKPGQLYVEPFCGGCNIIDKADGPRMASDVNPYLIAMWKALQAGRSFPCSIPKQDYDAARACFNEKRALDPALVGWIGFMASFNGRFFDGGYSGVSRGRDYVREQIKNTLQQLPNLQGVNFQSCGYDVLNLPQNCIIYCDPPYAGTKQYIYSKDFDHMQFWNWCRSMRARGHTIFVSEYKAPDDFECVWEGQVTNAMNTVKTYHPVERLFTLK